MSGIAAIYHLDGKPVDPQLLKRMTAVIAHRGPDGEGCWVGGFVGLGHRQLHTTEESCREQQPLSNRSEDCWITCDGRLDNREELIREFQAHGVWAVELTDSELVLQAYEVWGTDCLGKLIGDFAFVIWDGSRQTLLCARDHMGVRPLYYWFDGKKFICGSEIKQVFQDPTIQPSLNQGLVGDYLIRDFSNYLEETFYQGILRLPPAHFLVVGRDGVRKQRYWNLDLGFETRYATDEEYAEHFLEIFQEAVRCRLRGKNSVAVMMSGGLDSCSIACMAAEIYQRQEGSSTPYLHTFSYVFNELLPCDERQYIEDVSRKYLLHAKYVWADELWPLNDHPGAFSFHDEPPPGPQDCLWRPTLAQVQLADMRIVLTGHGGDHIFHSDMDSYILYLLSHLKIRTLLGAIPACREYWEQPLSRRLIPLVKRLIPSSLRSRLRNSSRRMLPPWIDMTFAQKVGLPRPKRRAHRQSGRSLRQEIYEIVTSGSQVCWLSFLDYVAAHFSMEVRHPYIDVRLVEFTLSLPFEQRIQDGRTKRPLREAMRGILPESIRTRNDKTGIEHLLDRGLRVRAPERVKEILASPRIASRGYVDLDKLQETYSQYWRGEPTRWDWLWYPLALELWLREGVRAGSD